jgi:hypothetical protein
MNSCKFCGEYTENKKYCSISCQNKDQNEERTVKKFGEKKMFDISCAKCGKEIKVLEREKLFPMKEKYYCNRSCANARVHSEETKDKISGTLIKKFLFKIKEKHPKSKVITIRKKRIRKQRVLIEKVCLYCGKTFFANKKRRKFCSISCSTTFSMRNGLTSKLGLLSAAKKYKRSKNEIYFSELCGGKFDNIKTNEPMFNGWDADVILMDFKIAVLWDGNWHHKKITKKHSLAAVQNRDKIKIKEIKNFGYEPYVIQDFVKYNRKFVENKFEEFLAFLKQKDYLCV